MMKEECLNFKQFYDIVSNKMPNGKLAGLNQHVEGCKKCADELDFIKSVYSSMHVDRKGKAEKHKIHITEEMKERYFQQSLPQSDIDKVHSHLVSCSDCFEEFSAISATAFLKPSPDEKLILEQIEAVEIKDRVAPYEKQLIREAASVSFADKLGQLIKNQKGRLSIPKLAAAISFVLVLAFFGYQQITWLNLLTKSSRIFSVVLAKNKIGFATPRLVGSIAKLTSNHRGRKSEQPEIHAAELALLDALKRKPDDVKLNHQLGTVYFFAGDMGKAEEYYLKALSLSKSNARIHNDLALIEINKENFEKTLTRLNQALQLNPNLLEARYNKAIVFEVRKDTVWAVQAWEKYLELDEDLNSDWNKVARSHLMELRE